MSQLFDAPPINIISKDGEALFYSNFFNKKDSDRIYQRLIDEVIWQQDKMTFYGKSINIPRLTAWYGDTNKIYSYSGITMSPHSWTPLLLEIKEKIEKESNVIFSSVLINRYRSGKDSVGWHSDDENELGVNPIIGSVSFGETRTFKLRNIEDQTLIKKIELTHGSFLLMKGETQHKWEHEVPKTSKNVGERINLTFRIIK